MIRITVPRVLAVCFVLIALSAEGRVRAVRKTQALLPSTPQCHTFPLVKAGTKGTYLSTTPTGSATYTITWTSMDHSIVVKQDAIDPVTGAITTATVLTNLVLPASVLHRPATEDHPNVPSGAH